MPTCREASKTDFEAQGWSPGWHNLEGRRSDIGSRNAKADDPKLQSRACSAKLLAEGSVPLRAAQRLGRSRRERIYDVATIVRAAALALIQFAASFCDGRL